MTDQTYQQMPAEEIALLLTEALRGELARILLEQDPGAILDDEEIDARIALLEQENLTLIPAFQIADTGEVPHLGPVLLSAGRTVSAAAMDRFFKTPREDLHGSSPRD